MTTWRTDAAPRRRARPFEAVKIDYAKAERLALAAWRQGGRRWLERAHRLAPRDQNIAFTLAVARYREGDPAAASALFETLARAHGTREAWAGLAGSALATGDVAAAVQAAAAALSRNAIDPTLADIAERVARAAGLPGWCGVTYAGTVHADPPGERLTLRLDDEPIDAAALPARMQGGRLLHVGHDGLPLLGSPIDLRAVRRVEGCGTADADTLHGWAWHPGSPETDPALRVLDAAGATLAQLVAHDTGIPVSGAAPLARPRGFRLPRPPGAARIIGKDGRDLLGSPFAAAGPVPRHRRQAAKTGPVEIIVPAHRGMAETLACIGSVLETTGTAARLTVVNDASPEPALVAALETMAATGAFRLLTTPRNLGYPGAANLGLRAARGRDAVLLNSDTLVAPGWLEALRHAAHSAPDIGTATPISNDATILSYPRPNEPNPAPDKTATCRLAALAWAANAGRVVEIPTGHGFCLYLRGDCLAQTGLLREDAFAQGYGEENDFCERARALGWRHVAVPGVFVAHLGGVSFGAAREALLQRNLAVLEALHPGYHDRIAAHLRADPLQPARMRLDAARWREGRVTAGAVLLVTHDRGGGVARVIAERVAAIRAAGHRPVVLRAVDGMCELGEAKRDFPNLRFELPEQSAVLARLLAGDRPVRAELHHLLDHDHALVDIIRGLGIPLDIWVHDYAAFCARVALVTGEGRYCGEPPVRTCETCVATYGSVLTDPIGPRALRARSAADFAAARRIVVPAEDVARRLIRHFPGIAPRIQPWQPAPPRAAPPPPAPGRTRVAVIGGIGLVKGFDVLLACARDAEARALDFEFVVIGYTVDDEALMATGRVFVTGEFRTDEAVATIRAEGPRLGFLPSIWPETWCYALTDAWEAGLDAVVFDLGAQAERVRADGRGHTLPLGLPAAGINDAITQLLGLAAGPAPAQHQPLDESGPGGGFVRGKGQS